MRVQIDSDVFKGRMMFEFATVGRYLEPILARLVEADATPAPPAKKPATKPRARRAKAATAAKKK